MFGRIRSSTPAGINCRHSLGYPLLLCTNWSLVRTDFFDDIFVPFEELPQGAE
jgi:DNA-directed RNA polymerase III subunit RPC8